MIKGHGPLGAGIKLHVINENGKVNIIFKPDGKSWKDALANSVIAPMDKIIASNLTVIAERNSEIKEDHADLQKMKNAHEQSLDSDFLDLTEEEAAAVHLQQKIVEGVEAKKISNKSIYYNKLNEVSKDAIKAASEIKKIQSKNEVKLKPIIDDTQPKDQNNKSNESNPKFLD